MQRSFSHSCVTDRMSEEPPTLHEIGKGGFHPYKHLTFYQFSKCGTFTPIFRFLHTNAKISHVIFGFRGLFCHFW